MQKGVAGKPIKADAVIALGSNDLRVAQICFLMVLASASFSQVVWGP